MVEFICALLPSRPYCSVKLDGIPFLRLDGQGKVGADVYPWLRSLMVHLDQQRDVIKIDKALQILGAFGFCNSLILR